MINLSNSLSLLRGLLAFVFLLESSALQLAAIIMAIVTDSIDGYLARRFKTTSRFGALLDPAMDKFFVFFVLTILFMSGKIELWQLFMMISRDCALCLFGVYLAISGLWKTYEFRSIRWGKITTAAQFLVLMMVTLGYHPQPVVFCSFVIFAVLALYELFERRLVRKES